MAERNGLLNRRTGYTVPRVRIPVSPQIFKIIKHRLERFSSGCSVARLSRLVWDQEVASSNLAIPTHHSMQSPSFYMEGFFVFIM